MPYLMRHRSWKQASQRADDLANAIDELHQASHDVPPAMRAELARLEHEAAERFRELAGWPAGRRRGHGVRI